MALVFLQANDGRSAMRSFGGELGESAGGVLRGDARPQTGLRREMQKADTRRAAVLDFLSSYDKQAKPTAPKKQAGEDGLGDIVVDPWSERKQDVESFTINAADIKSIETKNGHLMLKMAKEEITLSPIYLPAFPPSDGPAGRRFGNNYTRLFVRYPGLRRIKARRRRPDRIRRRSSVSTSPNAAASISTSLNQSVRLAL